MTCEKCRPTGQRSVVQGLGSLRTPPVAPIRYERGVVTVTGPPASASRNALRLQSGALLDGAPLMNLPFAKKPGDAAPLEAMAAELNARGLPYALGELSFPPGEWVAVTPGQAAQLGWLAWATVREKGAV
jgi:hypothetical protein